MKVFGLILLGLLVVGCVQADSPVKFKQEVVAEPYWQLHRVVDEDYKVVCYTHRESLSCVKL